MFLPFPNVRVVEMIPWLRILKLDPMTFVAMLRIFENPFSIEVSDTPEKLQVELI
jgi:hypothetical protein